MATINYIYRGRQRFEWLSAATALRRAIVDSFDAGCRNVPVDVGDFCKVMHDENSDDSRSLDEQIRDFACGNGFRYSVENHAQTIRFYV